jgi:hypothetical protein
VRLWHCLHSVNSQQAFVYSYVFKHEAKGSLECHVYSSAFVQYLNRASMIFVLLQRLPWVPFPHAHVSLFRQKGNAIPTVRQTEVFMGYGEQSPCSRIGWMFSSDCDRMLFSKTSADSDEQLVAVAVGCTKERHSAL